MRTGRWWMGASLGMALLLASYGLRAQEPLRTMPRGGATHTTLPQSVSESHTEEHGETHGVEEASEGEEGSEGGLFGNADFLLVRPRRRPHDFAIVDPNGNNAALEGNVAHFDWDTVGAYRIGLGYKLNHDWEFGGTYTYVHSKDDQSIARPVNGALYATMSAPFTFDSANSAFGSSNLDLDTVDVELAKTFCPCEGLILRLGGGTKIATIKQKQSVGYDLSTVGLGVSNVDNRIQFDGVGVRVGGEGWWKMPWMNIGIYAKAYTSLMSGNFNTHVDQFINDGRTPAINVDDHFHKVIPVTELGWGIGWKGDHMSFTLGWEFHNYFGMVDIIDFPSGTSFKPFYKNGDLSLEALTASVGFNF